MNYIGKCNVPDCKDEFGRWLKAYCIDGVKYETVAGKLWQGINYRCKANSVAQKRKPRYVGCENRFKDFQHLAEWCQSQIGYDKIGDGGGRWHLDKDLLIRGNKIYSPDTCVFLPSELNTLLISSNSSRGEYPIGVHKPAKLNKFMAQCQNGTGKPAYLGLHSTVEEAFYAYKKFKEDFIKQQAEKYRHVIDKRAYMALTEYEVLITD